MRQFKNTELDHFSLCLCVSVVNCFAFDFQEPSHANV
jgi:hypothetical protein